MEQFGDIVLEAEQSFAKLHEQHQVISTESKARMAVQKISEEAQNDPDPFTVDERVQGKLKELGDSLSSEISSPFARARFQQSYGATAFAASNTIRQQSRQRQIDVTQADLFSRDDQLVRSFFETNDPNEKRMYVGMIESGVAQAQAGMWIEPLKARKYLEERLEELRTGQVFHDMSNLPVESVIHELEAGDDGRYANLRPKERVDALKHARSLQDKQTKQQDRLVDKIEDMTEEKTALRLSNNDIEIEELQELLQGRTNPETGEFEKVGMSFFEKGLNRLTKLENDPDLPAAEKAGMYAELLTDFTSLRRKGKKGASTFGDAEGNDLQSVRVFREKVIENANHLTVAQTQMFLESTQANFDEAMKPRINWLNRIIEFSKAGLAGLSKEEVNIRIAELGERYLARTQSKELTEEQFGEEAKRVMDDDLKARNPNRTAYEIGQVIRRKSGSYEVVGYNENGDPLFKRK